mgnify:CR=1 FL=1
MSLLLSMTLAAAALQGEPATPTNTAPPATTSTQESGPDQGGSDTTPASAEDLRVRIREMRMTEEDDLQRRKERVNEMVQGVSQRDRERQRLADQVESASVRPEDLGMPLSSIGLAPPPIATEASAPFDDDALLGDLLERDPRSARRLLFQTDPTRYWERFPLRPPTRELSQAMRFPLPDPPGQR